jgi:subtilisin family serine protease
MERFPYMTNEQARDVLLTTATHLGSGPADVPNERSAASEMSFDQMSSVPPGRVAVKRPRNWPGPFMARPRSILPQPGYGSKSGTSMSAPHVTGALALVMERFPYMTNEQARDTVLRMPRPGAAMHQYLASPQRLNAVPSSMVRPEAPSTGASPRPAAAS